MSDLAPSQKLSPAHLAAAQKLIDGVPGYEVRAELEQTNLKLSSLSSTMSRVRSVVVEAGHRHPEYEQSCAPCAVARERRANDSELSETLRLYPDTLTRP